MLKQRIICPIRKCYNLFRQNSFIQNEYSNYRQNNFIQNKYSRQKYVAIPLAPPKTDYVFRIQTKLSKLLSLKQNFKFLVAIHCSTSYIQELTVLFFKALPKLFSCFDEKPSDYQRVPSIYRNNKVTTIFALTAQLVSKHIYAPT